ncbi:hypothetical protein [Pseudonocardia nigra]|uniref:hypothetical protein n=1 Tax=Pseudonocardia nigra TaxID=1921578 RepID=UPI001C5EB0BD|nr:hypothetical protein [Pseudonocardia nigra]
MPDAGTGLLIVTVAAPTNAADGSRPSSPSMAGIARQVGILGGGQQMLPATDGDDDGVVHGDDVNRAFRAVFVGVVARWSPWCRSWSST